MTSSTVHAHCLSDLNDLQETGADGDADLWFRRRLWGGCRLVGCEQEMI